MPRFPCQSQLALKNKAADRESSACRTNNRAGIPKNCSEGYTIQQFNSSCTRSAERLPAISSDPEHEVQRKNRQGRRAHCNAVFPLPSSLNPACISQRGLWPSSRKLRVHESQWDWRNSSPRLDVIGRDPLIHREIANAINGLVKFLQVEPRRLRLASTNASIG